MVDAKRKTFGWLFPTDSWECVRDRLGFCGTLALICAVLLLSSQFAVAQFTQQGPKQPAPVRLEARMETSFKVPP